MEYANPQRRVSPAISPASSFASLGVSDVDAPPVVAPLRGVDDKGGGAENGLRSPNLLDRTPHQAFTLGGADPADLFVSTPSAGTRSPDGTPAGRASRGAIELVGNGFDSGAGRRESLPGRLHVDASGFVAPWQAEVQYL